MLAVEKRIPFGPALLIATSALVLSGCVSNKKAADAAAVVSPVESTAAVQQATASPTAQPGYRDPMVANVSGQQPAQVPAAQSMAVGSTASAPANIGGLAMQSTGINAQAMSIFSAHTLPQNNPTSTQVQPVTSNAYTPAGVSPMRSSVYSSQLPVDQPQQTQQTQPLLPQQSSQNTAIRGEPVQSASLSTGALAGQTMNALYSAPRQNLLGSLSGLLQKASLPGMTRIAPNGLHLQNDKVEVGCFKPNLLNVIRAVEKHFGKPLVVTSGYRDPDHNRMVGGAEESMHKTCDAADIQIDGVSKWDIASYIRSLPDRGGVGTYCHTNSVHLDTGKSRDWNWGCGGGTAASPLARAL